MLFAKEHKRLGSYMWEDAEAVSVQKDLQSSILMTRCKVRRKINGILDTLKGKSVHSASILVTPPAAIFKEFLLPNWKVKDLYRNQEGTIYKKCYVEWFLKTFLIKCINSTSRWMFILFCYFIILTTGTLFLFIYLLHQSCNNSTTPLFLFYSILNIQNI